MSAHYLKTVVFSCAIAVTGCVAAPEVLTPSCADPAYLDGSFDPGAPGYVVTLKDEVDDVAGSAKELAAKLAFEIDEPYQSAIKGFVTKALTPQTLAELRCDPRVLGVSHNEHIRMRER